MNDLTRFFRKFKADEETGCWNWSAHTDRGYGSFYDSTSRDEIRAHRWAYEEFRGPIPEGLQLDHLCRNRSCVNPAHLEPVTPWENTRRGDSPVAKNARRTHCKNGHPFDTENTIIRPSSGHRRCRVCVRIWSQQARAKRAVDA